MHLHTANLLLRCIFFPELMCFSNNLITISRIVILTIRTLRRLRLALLLTNNALSSMFPISLDRRPPFPCLHRSYKYLFSCFEDASNARYVNFGAFICPPVSQYPLVLMLCTTYLLHAFGEITQFQSYFYISSEFPNLFMAVYEKGQKSISYCIISCHVMSCYVMSCHVSSYLII